MVCAEIGKMFSNNFKLEDSSLNKYEINILKYIIYLYTCFIYY